MSSLSDVSSKFTEKSLDEIIIKAGGVKHTEWKFAGGFKKGDSYLSEVFKMIVKGVDKDQKEIVANLVIKSIPKNIARRKTFRSTDLFRNECRFYNTILPAFKEFQKNCNSVDQFDAVPLCFSAYSDGENDFIALDDLGKHEFTTADRQNGHDINHSRLIMKLLGRFHGVSIAMRDQNPELFSKLIDSMEEVYYADRFKEWFQPLLVTEMEISKDAVGKEYPGTEIEEKMLKFIETGFYEKMVKLTHTRNKNSVISHGDCWAPNFMMKYDENNIPIDVRMFDFQLARCSSPALDVSFFIYTCTSMELREQYYEELLKVYHKSLSDLVRDLGSDPAVLFPYYEFEKEMQESARFGVGMGMDNLPFSIMDDCETPDLDALEGDEAVPLSQILVLKPIESKEGRLRIADMFKHAVQLGYLD